MSGTSHKTVSSHKPLASILTLPISVSSGDGRKVTDIYECASMEGYNPKNLKDI
jgi:hypothetical protein